jgi:NAD(P)-dependent dehydrogenase (short-subunit alcohol dehydrogenase family)
MKLQGKIALVSGAGTNLGKVYAQALASEGAAVVIGDINAEWAKESAADIAAEFKAIGAKTIGVEMDVGRDDHIAAAVQTAVSEFGGLDILVNNAGLARGRWNLNTELTTDEWMQICKINIVSSVIAAREARPHMVKRGGGVIVNQSSQAGYHNITGAYGITKLAVSGVTVALANEFADDNIRVNGIAPGLMNGRMPQDVVDMVVAKQRIHRRGKPEDLAGTLLYLCTDASSFVTGQTLIVDGGITSRP